MEIQIQNTIQFYFPTTAVSLSVFSATMQKKKNIEKVSIITSSARYTFQKPSAK